MTESRWNKCDISHKSLEVQVMQSPKNGEEREGTWT